MTAAAAAAASVCWNPALMRHARPKRRAWACWMGVGANAGWATPAWSGWGIPQLSMRMPKSGVGIPPTARGCVVGTAPIPAMRLPGAVALSAGSPNIPAQVITLARVLNPANSASVGSADRPGGDSHCGPAGKNKVLIGLGQGHADSPLRPESRGDYHAKNEDDRCGENRNRIVLRERGDCDDHGACPDGLNAHAPVYPVCEAR